MRPNGGATINSAEGTPDKFTQQIHYDQIALLTLAPLVPRASGQVPNPQRSAASTRVQ